MSARTAELAVPEGDGKQCRSATAEAILAGMNLWNARYAETIRALEEGELGPEVPAVPAVVLESAEGLPVSDEEMERLAAAGRKLSDRNTRNTLIAFGDCDAAKARRFDPEKCRVYEG